MEVGKIDLGYLRELHMKYQEFNRLLVDQNGFGSVLFNVDTNNKNADEVF